MEKLLTEELLKQLSLIKYDRSKTLLEQGELKPWERYPYISKKTEISDRYSDFNAQVPIYKDTQPLEVKIYNGLKKEIDGWGSDDDEVLRLVSMITRENYPKLLELVIKNVAHGTIMEWIMTDYQKVSERSHDEGKPKDFWTKPGGVERYFNWYQNDKTVITISKVLGRFDDLNTGEGDYDVSSQGEVDLYSDGMQGAATNKELAVIGHVMIPIMAMIVTFGVGGVVGFIAGALIEIGDAAIYEFIDKDHYAAGLALIFAFAGPLDNVLGPLIKRFGKSIFIKLMGKGVLNEAEHATIRYVSRNQARLLGLTYLGMVRKLIKDFIFDIASTSKIVTFIFWLVKKGYLIAKFTSEMGLVIGGTFLTWDAIADKLGLCNSVQLSGLKQSDYKILKILGVVGEYTQPYTEGCKSDEGAKILKQLEETLLTNSNRIKMSLESLITAGTTFTTDFSAYKLPEVALLQYVLYYLGFSYIIPKQQEVDKNVQKGVKFTKEQCMGMMLGSIDMYKLSQHPECNQYINPNKNISKETETILKAKPLNTNNKYDYGKNVTFKWGYYDKQTEDMVKEFQTKYKVAGGADGKLGKNTLVKMQSIVNGLGNKEIPDYGKLDWSKKEIDKLRKIVEDHFKNKTSTDNVKNPEITKEDVEESIQYQKDTIVSNLNRANNNIRFNPEDIKAIEIETEIKK